MKKILHRMSQHGAGDNVQFTSVIRHLKRYRPDWLNYVLTHPGKHTAFDHGIIQTEGLQFDETFEHRWHEGRTSYRDAPGTKTARCLNDIFKIKPDWELLRYEIPPNEKAERIAATAVDAIPGVHPLVLIHYMGESSQERKNLSHDDIRPVCEWFVKNGFTPVVLDWEHRSPIPDGVNVLRAKIPKDVACVAAFIRRAALVIGIDSGPSKIAYATDTPTITVWTGYHPYHYCDNAPNAFHLVPVGHERLVSGNREAALKFFRERYPHVVYERSSLAQQIILESARMLKVKINHMNNLLTATSFDSTYYTQHRIAGLDYLSYGDWQRNYAKWMADSLKLKGKVVLDVGCACGAIAAGFAEAGTYVSGIDPNEHMIRMGREKWLASTLKVGDAVNLHYWPDDTFDFLHSAQVFEHFKPELVPFILIELRRVLKADGRMFFALDTEEMYDRQGRRLEDEDKTHFCVKPRKWWVDQLARAGWAEDKGAAEALSSHPGNFFKSHDWDWFVVRKA